MLRDFDNSEDNEKDDSFQKIAEKVGENKFMKIVAKELEIKEELHNIEIITIQALEAMVDDLVLDQVQEQEKWKSTSKNIH